MKTFEQYMKCEGCREEAFDCYEYQQIKGVDAGLQFTENHVSFFAIDNKTGEFIVPIFSRMKEEKEDEEI